MVSAGKTMDDLICLTDLPATLAALTGVELPDAFEDSHNVLPSLLGNAETGEQSGADSMDTDSSNLLSSGRPTLVSDTGGFASTTGDMAIRWRQWKLILLARDDNDALARRRRPVPDAVDGKLLFDLVGDPSEEHNLIDEQPDIAEWLEELLEEVKTKGSRHVDPTPPRDRFPEEQ
jgi:arylsulfatase A-like enzyme